MISCNISRWSCGEESIEAVPCMVWSTVDGCRNEFLLNFVKNGNISVLSFMDHIMR